MKNGQGSGASAAKRHQKPAKKTRNRAAAAAHGAGKKEERATRQAKKPAASTKWHQYGHETGDIKAPGANAFVVGGEDGHQNWAKSKWAKRLFSSLFARRSLWHGIT